MLFCAAPFTAFTLGYSTSAVLRYSIINVQYFKSVII
nr:MAG TPA: hypothetical protein [Caudoviricetes sp.]